ncbi:MAG: hypothetical protein P1V81_11300 [Planctomycetota bacterium]|nr:hypothetical protein [Planctomycetota bacterium]
MLDLTPAALALLALLPLAPVADEPPPPPAEPPQATVWEFLVDKYDANEDGRITKKEYTGISERWKLLDLDGNGWIDEEEVESRGRVAKPRPDKKKVTAPKVGRKAPTFELEVVTDPAHLPEERPDGEEEPGKDPKKDGKDAKDAKDAKPKEPETIALADFRGKRPVALIFGSYT